MSIKSTFFDGNPINRKLNFGALYDMRKNWKPDFGILKDMQENKGLLADKLERGIKPLYLYRYRGEVMWMILLKGNILWTSLNKQ